jgi:hypothetical protein
VEVNNKLPPEAAVYHLTAVPAITILAKVGVFKEQKVWEPPPDGGPGSVIVTVTA